MQLCSYRIYNVFSSEIVVAMSLNGESVQTCNRLVNSFSLVSNSVYLHAYTCFFVCEFRTNPNVSYVALHLLWYSDALINTTGLMNVTIEIIQIFNFPGSEP